MFLLNEGYIMKVLRYTLVAALSVAMSGGNDLRHRFISNGYVLHTNDFGERISQPFDQFPFRDNGKTGDIWKRDRLSCWEFWIIRQKSYNNVYNECIISPDLAECQELCKFIWGPASIAGTNIRLSFRLRMNA